MNKTIRYILSLVVITAAGCSTKSPVAPTGDAPETAYDGRVDTAELDRLERLAAQPDGGMGEISRSKQLVVLPAGSHDALAGAITSAGSGGVVLIKSGSHSESGTVTIGIPVTLIGEQGAELVSSAGTAEPGWWHPALYVRAGDVTILGLAIRSSLPDGNATGVWIQGVNGAIIFNNRISGFVQGMLVNRSDNVKLWKNVVDVAPGGDGMDLAYGSGASVLRNEVLNAGFAGIFVSGTNGQLAFNRIHDSYMGVIFCTAGGFPLPEGGTEGPGVPANGWFATLNTTVNNITNGIVVIDRSEHNLLVSNASSGNGTYDIELAGDSFRFGFLTPASHDNTFIAGQYPTIEVKNCGTNNTIIGGTLIDNTLEPCD